MIHGRNILDVVVDEQDLNNDEIAGFVQSHGVCADCLYSVADEYAKGAIRELVVEVTAHTDDDPLAIAQVLVKAGFMQGFMAGVMATDDEAEVTT